MRFESYKLFNHAEFLATDLVSRTIAVNLERRGVTTFHLTRGNTVAITYEGVMLPVNFLDRNPYYRDGYAVYIDGNDDVWFGFEVPE